MVPGPSGGARKAPLLEIGRVARPHGLLGEVVVALVTNRTERLAAGNELQCRLPGRPQTFPGKGPGGEERVLEVRSSRPFQGRYLVQFEGVHSREAADELRDGLLYAPAVDDPEALFVHDLVGREVVEVDGTRRGTVVAVQANPASDLLVLEDGSLVPLTFVVGREEDHLLVDAPAGLFD
jgi:16S rRNA processing protein RimM